MLQFKSVIPSTLELLKSLSSFSTLQDFYLVGGTALVLHLGHRVSVDLDFFTSLEFETEPIINEIKSNYSLKILQQKEKNSITAHIESPVHSGEFVKVDILRYNHPLINEVIKEEKIRLLSITDIIPMKLSAITNRGAKKDFFDIFELLQHCSLEEMMNYYIKKFPDTDTFQTLKSLTFFEDAEDDFDPISLNNTSWEEVKEKIEKAVRGYL